MNVLQRFMRNSFFLAVATGIDRLANFVLVLYLTRILDAESLGIYFIGISAYFIFHNPISYGLTQLVTRALARDRSDVGDRLAALVTIGLGLGAGASLAMLLTAVLFDYDSEVTIGFAILAAGLFPSGLRAVLAAVFNGIEELEYTAGVMAGNGIMRLTASFLVLSLGFGINAVFAVLAISQWLTVVLYILIVQRRFGLSISWPVTTDLRGFVRPALTLAVMSIFIVSANDVDVLIISRLGTVTAAGVFALGFRLLQTVFIVRPIVMSALFPSLVQSATDLQQLQRLTVTMWRIFVLLFAPIPILVFFLANPLVTLLYGQEYAAVTPVLQILAWALPLSFLMVGLQQILLAVDREDVALMLSITSTIANVIAAIVLIPRSGAIGAAIASSFSMAVALIGSAVWIQRNLIPISLGRLLARPLLALAGALAVGIGIVALGLGPLWAAIAFSAGYLGLLAPTGAVRVEEIKTMGRFALQRLERRA